MKIDLSIIVSVLIAIPGGYAWMMAYYKRKESHHLLKLAKAMMDNCNEVVTANIKKAEENRLLDIYYPPGSEIGEAFKSWMLQYPNRSPLLWVLFKLHSHAEIANSTNPDQIIYYEPDIIELLKNLGFGTEWGDEIPNKAL